MRYRPRPRPLPFSALSGLPTESPLPRFAAPVDRSASFERVGADPARHRVELRPAGERLFVHCFGTGRRELTVTLSAAEPGPTTVRVGLPAQLTDQLARLAEASSALMAGAIFDAVLVDRPGFRAVGAVGAPLADALIVSDLPYLDGELLIGRPWAERRALLEELIAAVPDPALVAVTETRELDGDFRIPTPSGFVVIIHDTTSVYRARPAR
jgi:hypothetical protein